MGVRGVREGKVLQEKTGREFKKLRRVLRLILLANSRVASKRR
jgi:hypothetical protein